MSKINTHLDGPTWRRCHIRYMCIRFSAECFNQVQAGLAKDDRSHVHSVRQTG
jgi:hypothetical protein